MTDNGQSSTWNVGLARRSVVVIGGSSGIGKAISDFAKAEGHRVLCLHRRAENPHYRFDLRWPLERINDSLGKALETCWPAQKGFNWLVVAGGTGAYQNAAYASILRAHDPQEETDRLNRFDSTASEVLDTNLRGAAFAIEAALPKLALAASETGQLSRVLVIGSIIPRNPPADLAFYASAKAGLDVFCQATARRWAPRGVQINVLSTGWIDTPLIQKIDDRKKALILDAIPLHRWGEPEEAASFAYLLLTKAPSYASGEVWPMSGGL